MYSVTVCTTQILTYVLPYILKYMYLPRVCLQICSLLLCTCFHYPITTFSKYVGNKDMTRVLLYNICWHIFCSLNHQNCRMYYSTAHKTFLGFFCSLESLAAHRCGRDEFRISNFENRLSFLIFSNSACLRKTSTINKYSKFDTSESMSYQGHKAISS